MHVTIRASGPASPGLVWARYENPALWPTWAPQITRVTYADNRLRVGGTGRVHGPLGLAGDFTITRVEKPSWAWTVTAGPLTMHLTHDVRSNPRCNRTVAVLRIDGPAPMIAAYAPLAYLALKRLCR